MSIHFIQSLAVHVKKKAAAVAAAIMERIINYNLGG
jgi:hypothetical protein